MMLGGSPPLVENNIFRTLRNYGLDPTAPVKSASLRKPVGAGEVVKPAFTLSGLASKCRNSDGRS